MSKEKKDKHFIKKAYYEGGVQAMRAFIKKELRYPKAALKERVEGTVSLRCAINHQGKVTEVKIISGPGYGCEEEAERLMKMMKFKVPKNRKVRVLFHKNMQIHFRLPEEREKREQGSQGEQREGVQMQYTITSSKKKEEDKKEKGRKGGKGGYGYTIRWE